MDNKLLSRLAGIGVFGLFVLLLFKTPVHAIIANNPTCPKPAPLVFKHQQIRGAVLPHHQFAKPIWDSTFHQLAQQPVKKIILLAPNHFWLGKQAALTASEPVSSSELMVKISEPEIRAINQLSWIGDEPLVVWQDHGITNLLPTIKQQLPNVEIVPLIFNKNLSLKQINELVAALSPYIDQQTVVIASLDFAHDVIPTQAAKNDQKTKYLIQSRDFNGLLKLNSQFIDSPVVLTLYFKLLDKKGYQSRLVWQSHAGEYYQDCVNPTTSYQVWVSQ